MQCHRYLGTALVAVFLLAPAMLLTGCRDGAYVNREGHYLNRRDTATFSSGDAKAANAAIHTIDPWPAYSKDTRIAHDGARMQVGMERYKQNKSIEPKGLSTSDLSTEGVAGSGEGNDSK
ncbi:MAG: hypothetical protein AB7U38_04215 [Hyphomicrobiales bacterium]